jgi:SAM-dependent methyltransferase
MIYQKLINSLHTSDPYYGFNTNIYPKLQEIPGWHGNDLIFSELIQEARPDTILEIGSWKGQSSINMAKTIKRLGLNSIIVCVDTWLGSVDFIAAENKLDNSRDCYPVFGYPQVYYHFLANVINHNVNDIIVPFPQVCSIACQWFISNNLKFDLIYIDGSNNYEDIMYDLHCTWKVLNNEGIIFGDDFNNHNFPSIKKAVNEFCKSYNLSYDLNENELFWIIRKK